MFKREASNKNVDLLSPDMMKLLTPILAGFNVAINVSVPGKVIKTNAHKISANTASWNYDFDKNQNAFSALQNQQFNIVFEGKGLNLPTVTQR